MSDTSYGRGPMMVYLDFLHRKCIEPVKRNHGNGLEWQAHRFPIRGGISWREVMKEDLRSRIEGEAE